MSHNTLWSEISHTIASNEVIVKSNAFDYNCDSEFSSDVPLLPNHKQAINDCTNVVTQGDDMCNVHYSNITELSGRENMYDSISDVSLPDSTGSNITELSGSISDVSLSERSSAVELPFNKALGTPFHLFDY